MIDSRTLAAGRAVEVYRPRETGGYATGTGFLLDDGLVLTAGHVAGPAGGRALVRMPGRNDRWTTVLWHRHDKPPGTGVDAALLRFDGGAVPGPPGGLPTLGWGRLAGTRGTRAAEAVGFPAGMNLITEGTLTFRDSAHITGEITPGSRLKAGRYEITVRTPVPPARPAPPSAAQATSPRRRPPTRWSGMSGAGVVCEGLLVGLVCVDPGDPAGGALTAVPVESVLADPEVIRLLGRVRPRSVELAPVLLSPSAPPGSPAGLLRAEVSPVGCHGRDDWLTALTDWCREPRDFSLRLLAAPGGQGKTRLARELVERMTDHGWAAGFLDDQCPDDRLGLLATLSDPLLLVLDYAETRPEQLRACLRALRPASGAAPVRLLLLARGAGEWWRHAQVTTRALREFPPDAVLDLEPLAQDPRSRAEAFRRAADELAPALAALTGLPDSAETEPPSGPPHLAGPRYSGALALNMAALTSLLERARPTPKRTDPATLEEEILLLHEEHYWTQTATAHGIGHLHPATLRQLVATATLHRAATLTEARALLACLDCMTGETGNTRLAAAVWLHELYGGQDTYWAGLSPDPLGAHQVGSTLRDFPELLPEIAARTTRDQSAHLLRVLCRASEPFPELRERIVAAVTARPRPLALAAVDLLIQEPSTTLTTALDAALTNTVDTTNPAATSSDAALPADLLSAVPRYTEILARPALAMARQNVARLRAATHTAPGSLADALLALAYRLSATGRHQEAVEAAEEAVRLRGEDAAPAELIDMLLGYGARLADAGRFDDAARTGDRLLALTGEGAGSPAHAVDDTEGAARLAKVLHHHARWCHGADRAADALHAGARSVAIRRHLAAHDPDRPPEELAGSLLGYAVYLQAAGAPEKAVEPLGEAVDTLRELAEKSPDGHLAALGRALHDQGRLYAALRAPELALTCAQEAAAIHRRLAGDGTSAPRMSDLAFVLVGLAARLTDVGRTASAVDVLAEAVALRRTLAADGAATGLLAVTLTDHAVLLRQTGRLADSERATDEAMRLLGEARSARWSPPGRDSAHILLHRGLALAARDPAAARGILRRAAQEAAGCGATRLAERCAAALRDVGTDGPVDSAHR
ncbi:trypsin-like peptidase domain-containing protein [Streptomyces sp. NPDC088794]|uniref:trypsin-like peptidase domain-containing protein n=1 Tax=Streptomyces sp. NPDC088794 TaxID=3365902 RepID=UPI00382F25F2